MADRSEVIAILSSGVSFRRFLFPYWLGSVFLAICLWLIYQFVLPKANAIWGIFEAKYVDYSPTETRAFPQNYYFRLARIRTHKNAERTVFQFHRIGAAHFGSKCHRH
jgi:lipopolysaccharide export system permease protein